MKRIQWIGIVIVLGLMLAVVLVLVRPAAPTAPKVASPEQPVSTIEQPVALDDAMLTLTVSDFHGFLDGTGSVASQVSPMMSGAMIGTMLGAQLGDPQLAGIPAGKGFAVVMMSPTNIFAMVEVDEAALAAYTNAVAKKGLLSVYRDGVLVLGTTPSIVEQGADRVSAVRGVLLAKRSPTLRIALQPARLIAEYKTGIDGLLGSFSEKLEQSMQTAQGGAPEVPQGTFKILEAELRVLLSLAEQVQTTEVTLAPANGSLQIVEVDQAVPGSRLAALCAAPVVNRWSPKVPSGVCASGAFQLEACIPNSRALSVFINGEMEHLMDVMDLTGTPVKGWLDYMNRSLALYGGTVSESIFGGETGSLS
ncbi:MAG: hypothetical protein PHP93_08070, partial [Kiritimatiellales bacterium]|nr:hypothetical protein [Kiritimatiellales bacterium]